jgi:ribokinase
MKPRAQVFVLGNHVQACCWHVSRLPQAGETFQAHGLTVEPGGKGLNVAIGLHRLGLDVFALMACGQDAAGNALIELLQSEGIDPSSVIRFPGTSGWGAGFIGANGQNAIAVYPGANLLLQAQHVEPLAPRIATADLVYGQFETSLSALTQAFELAHQYGVFTVLNPSPWQPPPKSLYETTNMLLVNETEAAALLKLPSSSGFSNWDEAKVSLQAGVAQLWLEWPALQYLVVTLGSLGASVWPRPSGHNAQVLYAPACPIHALDSVGAGDAFACGFLFQWLTSHQLERSLQAGQSLGAHMAATVGVLAGLPRASEASDVFDQYLPQPADWFQVVSGI